MAGLKEALDPGLAVTSLGLDKLHSWLIHQQVTNDMSLGFLKEGSIWSPSSQRTHSEVTVVEKLSALMFQVIHSLVFRMAVVD